jgi:hypothetical protein
MTVNLKTITIGTLILILAFFIGRWTSPKEVKTVTVTIPEKTGSSPVIINPKPIVTTKDSLIYQDSLIYTENPYNKELADRYLKLENEKDRLIEYLNSIQIRKYSAPFENDTIKITGNIEVEGTLKNIQYDWTIKEFKTDVKFEVPEPTIKFLIGGEVSNTIDLTKFNFSPKIGIQRKNGDLILGSYGIFDKSIQVGYLINLSK